MDIQFLTLKEVTIIYFMIMKKYGEGEHAGIKEQSLLESAVYRPQQSVFREDAYPSLFEKAAAFFDSLINNHCFYNGNKRTAFASVEVFLKKNGFYIIQDTDQNEEFTLSVAEGKLEVEGISKWLDHHTAIYSSR